MLATAVNEIVLTKELLDAGKNIYGWNEKQIRLLTSYPPEKGWMCKLVGKKVSLVAYEEFLKLRISL
jgi:hypothetical protein